MTDTKEIYNGDGQEEYDDFENMGLRENILKGVFGYGFEKPSAIQGRAIVPIIKGRDIIAQAQSGTGKTAAFVLSSLQNTDVEQKYIQALVIVPTRELAYQIKSVYDALAVYTGIKTAICVGGLNIKTNIDNVKESHIIIGTPGRVNDFIDKGILWTDNIKMLIIDEADAMLSQGFVLQIKNITRRIPISAQICLFSATMPNEIIKITSEFMTNPIQILVKREELTLEGIQQFYIYLDKEQYKFETLCDLYSSITLGQTIVYVNTKRRADWLSKRLNEQSFTTSVIHSEMSPVDRMRVMKDFKSGSSRILISTDLLSRGIDIQQVSVVVNYDIPKDIESYLHRIGRSGRFGRKGVAINFVTREDSSKMKHIENYYETLIEPLPEDIDRILHRK